MTSRDLAQLVATRKLLLVDLSPPYDWKMHLTNQCPRTNTSSDSRQNTWPCCCRKQQGSALELCRSNKEFEFTWWCLLLLSKWAELCFLERGKLWWPQDSHLNVIFFLALSITKTFSPKLFDSFHIACVTSSSYSEREWTSFLPLWIGISWRLSESYVSVCECFVKICCTVSWTPSYAQKHGLSLCVEKCIYTKSIVKDVHVMHV